MLYLCMLVNSFSYENNRKYIYNLTGRRAENEKDCALPDEYHVVNS